MQSLVDYESSEEEEESSEPIGTMPALPSFFAPVTRSRDDPALHQGRIRTHPHLQNNWATHVYVEVPVSEEIMQIKRFLLQNIKDSHDIEHEDERLHISLSRCVYFKEHQLENFVESLKRVLKNTTLKSINVSFAQLSVLTNDEGTRSFVTAEIGAGYNELLQLSRLVDGVLERFNQPTFYKPARFHASLVWSLCKDALERVVPRVPENFIEDLSAVWLSAAKVTVKMGNRVARLPLYA